MKELEVVERRVTIEADGVTATVSLPTKGSPKAAVFSQDETEVDVYTAEQAGTLERVFGRIRSLLAEHERALALRDMTGPQSNTAELPAETPRG